MDKEAWYIDSPFQDLDPQGQVTDNSMLGNPIHVGTLRDLTDSAVVPSDLVMGEQLSIEVNKFRSDLIRGRKARRPLTLVSDAIGQDKADKIFKDHGGVVPQEFIGENGAQRLVAVVQAGSEPRDNYTAQDYAERDYEEALGQSANQRGQTSRKKTTATEARIVQGNSAARAETEKDRIRDYFVALVRKFDAIVQRTATPQELAKVLGMQGAALWQQWRALPGRFAYDVLPDAGAYVDIHQARAEWLQKYELLRRDERWDAKDLLEEGARLFNRDPSKAVIDPPDKPKDPPSASIAFKGEDILANPGMAALMIDFCANGDIKLRPETLRLLDPLGLQAQAGAEAAAQQAGVAGGVPDPIAHGGAALKTERLNKHTEQRTGKLQGSVQ
jgi:hypothetical protein